MSRIKTNILINVWENIFLRTHSSRVIALKPKKLGIILLLDICMVVGLYFVPTKNGPTREKSLLANGDAFTVSTSAGEIQEFYNSSTEVLVGKVAGGLAIGIISFGELFGYDVSGDNFTYRSTMEIISPLSSSLRIIAIHNRHFNIYNLSEVQYEINASTLWDVPLAAVNGSIIEISPGQASLEFSCSRIDMDVKNVTLVLFFAPGELGSIRLPSMRAEGASTNAGSPSISFFVYTPIFWFDLALVINGLALFVRLVTSKKIDDSRSSDKKAGRWGVRALFLVFSLAAIFVILSVRNNMRWMQAPISQLLSIHPFILLIISMTGGAIIAILISLYFISPLILRIQGKLRLQGDIGYESLPHKEFAFNFRQYIQRIIYVFLLCVGLSTWLSQSNIIDSSWLLPAYMITDFQRQGIPPNLSGEYALFINIFLIPLVVSVWAVGWVLEDAGIIYFRDPKNKTVAFPEVQAIASKYNNLFKSFAGISAIFSYVSFILNALNQASFEGFLLTSSMWLLYIIALFPAYYIYWKRDKAWLLQGLSTLRVQVEKSAPINQVEQF